MDNRVRLASGGTVVVAASAAILWSAAMANATHLVDAAGQPVSVGAVMVAAPQLPSSSTRGSALLSDPVSVKTATANTDAVPADTAPTGAVPADTAPPGAVTVPAPAALVVAGDISSEAPVETEAAPMANITETARSHGAKEAARKAQPHGDAQGHQERGNGMSPQTPAHAGTSSDPAGEPRGVGSKRDQSLDSPDR
ncbi:hypothetical protein LG299_04015 [Microbacterium lacus]|uniref:hypothetical protein n=1 Tax=Microbacterium lacus TaxID=415217 RepID=UPI003850BB5C